MMFHTNYTHHLELQNLKEVFLTQALQKFLNIRN